MPDWPQRLARELAAWHTRPFAWGTHDCATAALRAIDACCATALAPLVVGHYRDQLGAVRWLRRRGYGSLLAAASAWVGVPDRALPADSRQIQPGDLAFLAAPRDVFGGALAVFYGDVITGPNPRWAGWYRWASLAASLRWLPVGSCPRS